MPGAGAAPLAPAAEVERRQRRVAGPLVLVGATGERSWPVEEPSNLAAGRYRCHPIIRNGVQQGDEGMTVRRVAAEVALVVSVVIVATATGAVLGLRAFDKWMSAPARPNRTL